MHNHYTMFAAYNGWANDRLFQSAAALTAEEAGQPLLSRAFAVGAPPGSTFKIVSAAAALMHGWSGEQRYACPGWYEAGGRVFRNFASKASTPFRVAPLLALDPVYGIENVGGLVNRVDHLAHFLDLGHQFAVHLPRFFSSQYES